MFLSNYWVDQMHLIIYFEILDEKTKGKEKERNLLVFFFSILKLLIAFFAI